MNNENKYWEELVSYADDENHEMDTTKSLSNPGFNADLKWISITKERLKTVLQWDYFDKKEAKLRIEHRLSKKQTPIRTLLNNAWVRAAILLLAILSGALINNFVRTTNHSTTYSEVIVPLGQMTQIKLPDGSNIYLNSGTKLKYPTAFDQSKREIFIDGEAFMDVSKNKHKPFIVNTTNFSITVLGTSFNVSAYSEDNRANVTLVEGSVQLQSKLKGWSKNMVPGQIATINNGDGPSVAQVNTEFYTTWKEGKIIFRKETLEEIAHKMERWYNVEIRFKNEELRTLEFSGTFLKYKPVDQIFKTLSIMDNRIDFSTENRIDQKDIIYIFKKK